jgi:multisubunit Na+/H+ antiporter MnhC subunit
MKFITKLGIIITAIGSIIVGYGLSLEPQMPVVTSGAWCSTMAPDPIVGEVAGLVSLGTFIIIMGVLLLGMQIIEVVE